jgi:hypothetical protein
VTARGMYLRAARPLQEWLAQSVPVSFSVPDFLNPDPGILVNPDQDSDQGFS